ncbi:hypothetical protein BC351_40450 [Paenibacillus ferrarius]|uniref:Uncharacterized protein n=1 Tax=Paenibacillus ferrarius TaxID=1469647 RepID=A0A1V4H794_9BACL|nr:hypothetical protein BC351_40450 [Paenibacillus ferrarius]
MPAASTEYIGHMNFDIRNDGSIVYEREKTLREQAHFWDEVSDRIIDVEPNLRGMLKRIRTQINLLCMH